MREREREREERMKEKEDRGRERDKDNERKRGETETRRKRERESKRRTSKGHLPNSTEVHASRVPHGLQHCDACAEVLGRFARPWPQ